jgi:uncharacterized protein (DUF433 family)
VRYNVFEMVQQSRGQLSMRPSVATLERLQHRARLTRQQKTALAERYLEEGLAMDEFPLIHFVDGALGRRAAVMGTGLDVWEIVRAIKDGGSIEEAAAYLEVEPRLVGAAAAYYGENRAEIDDWITRIDEISDREQAKWRAAHEAIAR